jgi:hypothetical protein
MERLLLQTNDDFARRLVYMADVRCVNRRALCELTGIDDKRMKRIMLGQLARGPTLVEVALIAKALKIQPRDLTGW